MPTNYIANVYLIRNLTNLHVGGGSSNYDYVDKQIQRDPTTNYPTIFSSGLKGAIRDHFAAAGVATDAIKHIFGNEPGDPTPAQGTYRFLSADLLAMPQPVAESGAAFRIVNSSEAQTQFLQKVALMGKDKVELGALGTADEKAFKELVNELPVLSRNHLENGVSQNLWYEEVVPREARFGFVLLAPENDGYLETFESIVHEKVIQVGANATIGYGLCHFQKIA